MGFIVTHQSPDWDAITFAWLMKRHVPAFKDHSIVLVNTGNPSSDILIRADAVGDTGRVLNPADWRFDHHHLRADCNNTCAAKQAFMFILGCQVEGSMTGSIVHMAPLIDLVFAGDTGKPEADESRKAGIHAILSQMKFENVSDDDLINYGFHILDSIERALLNNYLFGSAIGMVVAMYSDWLGRYNERQSALERVGIDPYVVYQSEDNELVALLNAPQGATFMAFDLGAKLVLWANYQDNAIGLNRARGSEINTGEIVNRVLKVSESWGEYSDIHQELLTWFQHDSGFFSGRGTAKAPREDPITIALEKLALLVDNFR